MQSETPLSEISATAPIKQFAISNWERLTDTQKNYAKKVWGVLTYKWRWQIAMNVPYLVIFLLDRLIPSVHQFDMELLATITSKLPVTPFISSLMGL